MTTDLAQQLADFCEKFKLKEKTFKSFEEFYPAYCEDENFLNGYEKSELKPVFDGHRFNIQHSFFLQRSTQKSVCTLKTRWFQ